MEKVDIEARPATLLAIKENLVSGWRIAAAVDSRSLNEKPGSSGHVIVGFNFDDKTSSLWVHRPGLSVRQNQQI